MEGALHPPWSGGPTADLLHEFRRCGNKYDTITAGPLHVEHQYKLKYII